MARRSQATAARAPLTKERVLRAALTLADESGIEGLSMRKLAQQLGVEAMSLYNHVANKDDILDGIAELVAGEIEPPPEDADWKAALRHAAIATHQTLLRHRWAAQVWMSVGNVGPARFRHGDTPLRILREAGFSPDLTYHAYHTLSSHVMGFTLYVLSFRFTADEFPDLAANFLRDFPADEYPDLAEHIRQHMQPRAEHEGAFEFGLDVILDGLERLRDAR